ncbi:DNA-packaging protein [Paenibacillus sp. FSL M7-0802]|uniref:DNA-packaging protein n=1 Tax=Paenibacillus sp. FSL M7-0802 TaxID=2921536 RepID=UPI0030F52DF9
MASHKNYSQRDRKHLDADAFKSPENFETNNVNELMLKSFDDMKDKWREYCSYFRHYPDHFLDFTSSPDSKIQLYFYQRIYLRIMLRYRKVYLTATRGTSKSYLQNLAYILKCIFYPKTRLFICAPGKEQATKIVSEKLDEIFDHYPMLKSEVKDISLQKDYIRVIFHNGSRYDVVQMSDATRGGRRFGGAIEEIADKKFNGDVLNSVIIPLMANNRTSMSGSIDPNELHKSEIYITTAGTQQQFAFEKLREVYNEMMDGKSAFCIGNSYELPCLYEQLDIDFVEALKDSPTYSIMDFMREYESLWTGSSSDSLVSDEKLNKTRIVGVAEWEHCGSENIEYVLAYDVSRNEGDENALSCLVVYKITPKSNGNYIKEVVNIFSMEGQHSQLQAKFLKQKVNEFKASILVIDANGLGVSVVDNLVLDLDDGNPPYSVVNDDRYDKYQAENSIPMVFALKSQNKETRESDMINHFMQTFAKMDVGLLKSPHEGIKDLEKKTKHKIKDSDEISRLQIPYVLTDILCEEIMNLKYKQSGNDTKVERVSSRIKKDKFSALMYGLFWIHLKEQNNKIQPAFVSNVLDYLYIS